MAIHRAFNCGVKVFGCFLILLSGKERSVLPKNMLATSEGYQQLKLIIIQLSHNDGYDSNRNYKSNIGEGEKVNTI